MVGSLSAPNDSSGQLANAAQNSGMIDFAHLLAAFSRAGRSLGTPGVFVHAVWPPLASLVLWSVLAAVFWAQAVGMAAAWLPAIPWAGWDWIASWAAVFLVIAALVSLMYVTTIVLVALVALPLMVNRVAAADYHELGRHGESVVTGSVLNTLGATLLYVVGMALCLPLLLIPGAILVIPLLWTAWLSYRTFGFDSLAEHATRAEIRTLLARNRATFFAAGAGCAALAHVPIVNLLVPAFTALVFVQLGLMLLRNLRREQGVEL